ncbi:Fic family protein [Cronobacter dublinensis subsp. lactaridi LMG 23825]|uniref:Fic family protein n=1 Tax=Cronobacter dublinensis TaxID=413497 RepID=UPI003CEBA657
MFSQQLAKSAVSDRSPLYPQCLYAWITGWHPFPDGNGRTARAAYAITAIRNGTWRPLTKADEDRLSGL